MLFLLVLNLTKFNFYFRPQQMGNSVFSKRFKSSQFRVILKISHKIWESKHVRTII